jgi:hypothetical protein
VNELVVGSEVGSGTVFCSVVSYACTSEDEIS